ncbi:ABC transporter ATP-binding protein [Streptomyces sp. DSM 44917]|uniref:ABC transporter ATP-binding protein n=1 Tax=Streptomyces boetiae TaxID=3075541 RepID=A0ABU2LBP7_9ACTN|nr:ABC transporter ATP-binding protein [Streptomyces sp. DSM 44917]MDT0309004.1 ABC transporter ATP-binding protein [Streptomyces sp. DSM 44917]
MDVRLAGRAVVSGARLIAPPGRLTGLIGPNGSGKSSLLRAVYRHLRPAAGRVLLDGEDLGALPPARAARRVAALPQERGETSEAFQLTVREVVALGRVPHQRAFAAESAADRAAVAGALAETGMGWAADRPFAALSGGERQRVLLARAFAQAADVLVLDEPTNHLDIRHQVELLTLLRRQRRTTLAALHDLNAAAAVCDRLHVLRDGRLVASGTPREVLRPALLAEVFGVSATVVERPDGGGPLIAFHYPPDTPGEERP